MQLAIWTCLVAGWLLTGISLVVAVVVYPAFDLVAEADWPRYHEQHSRRITTVVALPWLLEGIGTLGWLATDWSVLSVLHAIAAGATVGLTVFGAIPRHNEIARGRSKQALAKLQTANLMRTVAWALAATAATIQVA